MNSIITLGIQKVLKKIDNRFENLNILITGGAGFLGSWLCDILVEFNANVICLDNFSSGKEENIQHLQKKDNFTFIDHDISEPYHPELEIDLIFHFASRASPFEFKQFPIQILKANTLGTWVVLGITKKFNAKLILASTSEIYGDPPPTQIPTSEDYNGNVNPIGPRSCYDEAKRAGEAFAMAYLIQHNLDIRIVRIFNTYGPRIRPGNLYGRVVPIFITQALQNQNITVFGDGSQTRSFIYVSDELEGILLAAMSDKSKGQVFNLGSNQEITILELARKIQQLTDSYSQITFHELPIDDPRRRCPDITKAHKFLGWEPRTPLDNGLKSTIEWFKSQV